MMMMMIVHRLEDDTEEVTVREGESLTLGCQVIAGNTILVFFDLGLNLLICVFYLIKFITFRRS